MQSPYKRVPTSCWVPWDTENDEKDVYFVIVDVTKEIEERDLDTGLIPSFVVVRSIPFVVDIGGPKELVFLSETSYTPTEPIKSSYESPSSWETYPPDSLDFPNSPDHANYSDLDAFPDLSQIFLATKADTQQSIQTVDTSESLGETSEELAPMVEEPPDPRPMAKGPGPSPEAYKRSMV
ncbi:hypothetical protein Ddye_024776 [Dipteronia dyeriana]|uniref:Uncharacterized protein n=1 Tax=Dipteronia dyeriana TaxID=168575 RepID=A0AAD9TWH7_9ROSI|nr:hypothetical protein Ddye_024776 [Dipteronia dyeriana]